MTAARRSRLLLLAAFFAIYVIWGSTYLAIRYAVETIPPLLTAATRHLIAGAILYLWARSRGLRPTRQQWAAAALLGALYFLLGHGLLHWAEQVVPSGLAALLIATEPILIALLAALPREAPRPSALTMGGLALGFAGVGVLVGFDHASLSRAELVGMLAVLGGATAWTFGIFYSRTPRLPRDPVLTSSLALLTGSAMLIATSFAVGEPAHLDLAAVTLRSALALAYLVVFGSLVAFTAYSWLLTHCSPTTVATHTFVNPVVAVGLGWALAGEPLNGRVLAATAFIVTAVLLIWRGNAAAAAPAREPEFCAAD